MSARSTSRGAMAAPLLHWLLLVSGLALLTSMRLDALDKVLPLWIGSVVGTGLGQLLARWRVRVWLVVFIILNALWLGPLSMLHFLQLLSSPWPAVEMCLMAFAPATLCAYLSTSERAGLVAFWFPATLWMVAILECSRDSALSGAESWVLLSGLAVLLLAFLRLRETRRIGLWQRHATIRLADPRPPVVLRRAPLRFAAQLAWIASLAAATLVLTAWVAPHLWQTDKLDAAAQASNPGAGDEEPCCADLDHEEVSQKRVREYFAPLRARESEFLANPGHCLACQDGVPISATPAHGSSAGVVTSAEGSFANAATAVVGAQRSTAGVTPLAPIASATPSAVAAPIAAPPPPVVPPRPIGRTRSVRPTARPAMATMGPSLAQAEPSSPVDPLTSLLTLAALVTALHLFLRPLRRLIALRHLRRPFWAETVDQRVSNLWQLMLVGLRDAGFHTAPNEQPQELARRIDIDGMAICATVLERARHGVRVDTADLEAMQHAASAVYEAARRRAGLAARAAASLRWPLL